MLDRNHFEAGKNLTKGSRQLGGEKILVELMPQPLTSAVGAGGAAAETLAVEGLKTTDELLSVSQTVAGANSLPLLGAVIGSAANELDCTWSADPGAGAIVKILVRRDIPKS